MGGVDLMDGLMGRYHIRAKTRDPMTRLFYHFIDMAVTNAYILYRRIHTERMNDSNDISAEEVKLLQLPQFREQIAAALVTYSDKRNVGRPSVAGTSQAGTSTIGKRAVHPVDDVRFDNYDHSPIWGKKQKCKLCKKSDTQCMCTKCNIHLCCRADKNCFYKYHHPEKQQPNA